MRADLHNHTYLCNHANGEPRQYLEAAIARGIEIFGFADHAPMNFDQKYRMSFEQMELYERMIRDLRDEFSGRIDVRPGLPWEETEVKAMVTVMKPLMWQATWVTATAKPQYKAVVIQTLLEAK